MKSREPGCEPGRPPQKPRAGLRAGIPPQKPRAGLRAGIPPQKPRAGPRARLSCRRSQCYRLRLQEPDSELEALEANFLPSSRLANEAVGTAIRFIQGSASPPLPLGR